MPLIKYKDKTYSSSSGTNIILDTELDINSENGVQNKVVTEALDNKLNTTDIANWAKAETKPTYTYEEVGADESGAASTALISAQNYTNQKIADLVNSAPETLDTLGEIAEEIEENETIIEALNAAIGNKVNKTDVDSILSNTSTNPVQNKIITAALADKQDWLTKDALINSTVDWNTLTTTAIFPIGTEGNLSDEYTHGLEGVYGYGTLIVLARRGYGGWIYHIYINDHKEVYIRSFYGSWRAWDRVDAGRVATASQIGGVKSGGDITVASNGTVSVNTTQQTLGIVKDLGYFVGKTVAQVKQLILEAVNTALLNFNFCCIHWNGLDILQHWDEPDYVINTVGRCQITSIGSFSSTDGNIDYARFLVATYDIFLPVYNFYINNSNIGSLSKFLTTDDITPEMLEKLQNL